MHEKIWPATAADLRIALFQPDIAQNAGTILRLCACMGVRAELIEPAGFPVSDRHFRRAGMDYLEQVAIGRHRSWSAFENWRRRQQERSTEIDRDTGYRLIVLTTRATLAYTDFAFRCGDILLVGRESAGVPDEVHAAADARVVVPMRPGLRSLNVAVAAAMVLGEAMRQTGCYATGATDGWDGNETGSPAAVTTKNGVVKTAS